MTESVLIKLLGSVKFSMHFIAFSGQMHRDREEGASSALLYKRASRCHHVASLSRLNKKILAHYSRFNKIATLGYIMTHEGMGTDHYSMSRLTMRRSHSSTGYCYNAGRGTSETHRQREQNTSHICHGRSTSGVDELGGLSKKNQVRFYLFQTHSAQKRSCYRRGR